MSEFECETKPILRGDRPWGHYLSLFEDNGFKLKKIVVNPGERLSLQYHHKREEHWIVIKGSAKVTCGTSESVMHAGQYIHIPKGETHRLENTGQEPLWLVEVQCGDYLGEDDIVRLTDDYGRN